MILKQRSLWLLWLCLCNCAAAHWLLHPLDPQEFFANWYGRDYVLVPRPADYYSTQLGLGSADWLCRHLDAVNIKDAGVPQPKPQSCIELRKALHDGHSAMFRLEDAKDPDPQLSRLLKDVETTTGFPGTLHAYYGGGNSVGFLAPHTDPYDLFVMQIEGTKQWRLCVPSSNTLQVVMRVRR